jgi:hypothetical protein
MKYRIILQPRARHNFEEQYRLARGPIGQYHSNASRLT